MCCTSLLFSPHLLSVMSTNADAGACYFFPRERCSHTVTFCTACCVCNQSHPITQKGAPACPRPQHFVCGLQQLMPLSPPPAVLVRLKCCDEAPCLNRTAEETFSLPERELEYLLGATYWPTQLAYYRCYNSLPVGMLACCHTQFSWPCRQGGPSGGACHSIRLRALQGVVRRRPHELPIHLLFRSCSSFFRDTFTHACKTRNIANGSSNKTVLYLQLI